MAAATPAAIKAAMDAHATVKTLVDVTVTTNSVTMPVQAATALAGGTTKLTVSTTFSEAVVVGNVNMIEYDVGDNGTDQVDSATVSVDGSSVTSTWTLTGATHLTSPAVNADSIMYGAGITDLAGNTLTAVSPFLAVP